jgi:hypothetical protein
MVAKHQAYLNAVKWMHFKMDADKDPKDNMLQA